MGANSDIPQHLGIIMDGNGRWAMQRNKPRSYGHIKGARVVRQVIETCAKFKIRTLTLYTFSTENWLRPTDEVTILMRLLAHHLKKERRQMLKNNIRVTTIGDIQRLPEFVQKELKKTVELTCENTGLCVVLALSYSGRQEIVEAVQRLSRRVEQGKLKSELITEDTISKELFSSAYGDPDLIIRTSGELRLSNFLLWQSAYSELYFTETLWPDFSSEELLKALGEFGERQRCFGQTREQVQAEKPLNGVPLKEMGTQ